MIDLIEFHERAVAEFDARVASVKEDQWRDATPCSRWNVHDLVNHLVNEDRWTPPLIEGKTIAEVGSIFDGDLLGDVPKESWKEASIEARAAVRSVRGDLDRLVNVSWGQISAAEYIGQLWTDHLIHAWDLARAIGMDEQLDPELVAECLEQWGPQEEFMRSTGAFGSTVSPPTGADAQTRLLALFGRRV